MPEYQKTSSSYTAHRGNCTFQLHFQRVAFSLPVTPSFSNQFGLFTRTWKMEQHGIMAIYRDCARTKVEKRRQKDCFLPVTWLSSEWMLQSTEETFACERPSKCSRTPFISSSILLVGVNETLARAVNVYDAIAFNRTSKERLSVKGWRALPIESELTRTTPLCFPIEPPRFANGASPELRTMSFLLDNFNWRHFVLVLKSKASTLTQVCREFIFFSFFISSKI